MKAFLFLAILSTVICVSVSASAATWYVDGSVSSSGDGKSWETALKTIQGGINAASHGDTVLVGEGTYLENIQFHGKNIILTSTDPLDSDVVGGTIIDGNQAGSVVTFSGTETEACVLSGFTVRNGKSNEGGGISGGTWPNSTGATIQNNTITGNSSEGQGGGLSRGNGTIQNNTITRNSAGQNGGGLLYCNGTIQNNTITGNSATRDYYSAGGGLYACYGTIQNNTITGNSAVKYGGGLDGCNGTIQNNTITGNSADVYGGGLSDCNGTIRNCIIWGNTAPSGRQLYESSVPTYSCIEGWTEGGEGNIAPPSAGFVDSDGPDNDPATQEDNDYRLSEGSPCIDAGINGDWMWNAVDPDGNPRIAGGTVDMGAYEYGSRPFRISQVLVETTGELQLTWNSRPGDSYTVQSCTDVAVGNWIDEATIASGGETTAWTDPDVSTKAKFYRVEMK